jgi:hypothetical protein
MNKDVRFSEVPVGNNFEYKGKIYTRFTGFRGKQMINGELTFTRFPKHRMVMWLNAWPNNVEA